MENKKKYIKPEAEIIEFAEIDILTTSSGVDVKDIEDPEQIPFF